MEILGYLAALLMGVTLGLIGGGGSILTVPILVYLFGLPPSVSTGYSLFIVGLTALVGSFSYIKRGDVDFKTGLAFAAPSFVGVYVARAYVLPGLPEVLGEMGGFTFTKDVLVMLTFALLMVAASYSMIRKGKRKTTQTTAPQIKPLTRYGVIGVEGLVVGIITGFVGAGGGFLIIPALVILAGLSMKVAVGTSLLIISIKSLLGFTGDLSQGSSIDWGLLGTLSAISILGIVIGSTFANRVPEDKLKKGFGWFVLIMGTIILLEQLTGA